MSIEIDAREFRRAIETLASDVHNGAHQALVAATKATYDVARTTTLFKDGPTANARKSIRQLVPEPFVGVVKAGGAGAKEVIFLENGTRAHDIEPKRAKALRFTVNGQVFFRKVVHHPGTAERPFMAHAAAVGAQALDYGAEYFLERPIAHFNGGG